MRKNKEAMMAVSKKVGENRQEEPEIGEAKQNVTVLTSLEYKDQPARKKYDRIKSAQQFKTSSQVNLAYVD